MKKFYILLFVFLLALTGNAQINYSFSATTGTYTSVSGGTSPTLFPTSSGGTTDEGYAIIIPIGFSFSYNGNTYSTLGASTNGFVYLGSGGLNYNSVTYNNNLATGFTSTTRPLIAPFWDDIDIQLPTNLRYITTGTAPNRVFTIEWANVLWDNSATDAALSFELTLYESTNVIEFIYKQESGAIADFYGTLGASIGITASGTGIGNFISLSNSGSSPNASTSVNTTDIVTKPTTGQIYRFTPYLACSGMPVGGTATASVSTTCSGTSFNLSLSGYSNSSGITFQWQSSPQGQGTWSSIASATTANYTISQTEAKDYRCLVTCTNSSLASYSSSVTVGLTPTGSCVVANDDCTGATLLSQTEYNSTCTGASFNTSLATTSSNSSTFFATAPDDDVWYKFIATNNKVVVRFNNILAVNGIIGNISLAIIGGTDCSTLTEIGGATINTTSGVGEALFYGLTIGNTYYLRVATTTNTWRAQGNICVLEPLISSGTSNSCTTLNVPTIDATNNNIWVPITEGSKIVAEINAKGNNLGVITSSIYISSILRQYTPNGRYYLNRNVQITPTTQPTSNVLVRIYLLNTELNALIGQTGSNVSSINDLFITKNSDLCSANYNGGGTLITPTSRVSYGSLGAYLEFPVSSFSSFYIHGGESVLPTTITRFLGEKINGMNQLSWIATNEYDLSGYEIEKSIDGVHFSSIGFVESQHASTNNNTAYKFSDKLNTGINNYYRLKQLDNSGKFSYSKIVFIKGISANGIVLSNVYPNPTSNNLQVIIKSDMPDNSTIQITDIMGKVVLSKRIQLTEGENNLTFSLQSLTSGIYFIKLMNSMRVLGLPEKIVKL